MAQGKLRVLIVDDSGVFRGYWGRLLSGESDIEVVTTAVSAKAALEALAYHSIDLVLLDVEMPEMSGLEAIPHFLKAKPELKILIASSLTSSAAGRVTVEALTVGAHDFIGKPSSLVAGGDGSDVRANLLEKIRALSPYSGRVLGAGESKAPGGANAQAGDSRTAPRISGPVQVIAIGASTGGPNALSLVLSKLAESVRQPIVIVQHMPANLTAMLAERLGRDCKRPCAEGKDGTVLRQGSVYVAPGGRHMTVRRVGSDLVLGLNDDPPENFCRPAVDVLFRSVAEACSNASLGVVLTGMGEDGKRGSEALRACGAAVVAQDEASSVVWGMPGAVHRAGLASYTLPLTSISEKVSEMAARK